jgi:hypothetical protein
MRAYQLWNNGPWIDLDHVLGIDPPVFIDRMGSGGFFVEMNIRMMFQDKPRIISRYQETDKQRDPEMEVMAPECNANAWPTELHWMVYKVYEPLVKEWSGKQPGALDPLALGYDPRRYRKIRRG